MATWPVLTQVRPHEWPKLRFLLIQILISWTGLAIAMMVTDTLLLSTLGIKYLPAALLLSSIFTLSSSLGYTALLGRYQSLQLLQGTLALVGALLLTGFAGLKAGFAWLCLPLLALYGTNFSMVATQSFGLASECIDTYSSKRLFPVLTVAATCGELLGGLLVAAGARWIDPPGWVLVWSGSNFLALGWLWAHRHPLKQWRQQRTSRQPSGAILQYLRQAPMARALTLLLLGMVLCQGFSQYLFSQVFSHAFPQARDLAYFLGALVALTNLAELVIATQLTPRLVQWLGVARAGWLHPLLMLSGLVGLSLQFQLGPAVWLWICRRTMQDSLATPVRNLLYNAIPGRVRGHLRAFLDGVVVSCAQACVALLLILLQRQLAPVQISYAGVGLALVYWLGALGASRNYLRTLVGELEVEGLRLQSQSASETLIRPSTRPDRSLAEWETELLSARSPELAMDALARHSDPLALQMLARGLALPSSGRRHEVARRLAALGEPGVRAALPYLFSDQFATVEAALQVLGESATAWGVSLLQGQFASRARAAARAWLAGHQLAAGTLPERFLKEALYQECGRHQRLAFRVLRWLEGEELVETLRLALLSRGGRSAGALEVLSNLGERQLAQLFVTLLEPNSDTERARLLQEALGKAGTGVAALSDDPWVRWASVRASRAATDWELNKMEQLLALRRTRPFHRLDLDQLEVARLRMVEERFQGGRLFWQAGQVLKRAFVPLQGDLENGFLGGVELVGQFPARSGLVTRGPVRVLSLARPDWEHILRYLPDLASGTFQWLSAELRRSEMAA
ncbi:MAG: hypothetical protein KF760_27945 [Candidatus Eremiobacteraeota bacterium]|nr:hypothetical protein [Candidatus Eremiobacteraeota bacterium]MCW5869166.1 hypothetical protein [Candidatus Eremiobacteraeota bacterium]